MNSSATGSAVFFEVEDAEFDERFSAKPLVAQAPHYHHYAAVPLLGARSYLLGILTALRERADYAGAPAPTVTQLRALLA